VVATPRRTDGRLASRTVLEELRISGLGVIEDAVLDLSPGLTVVTGETGAGKTMVVTGLALLFGGRADAALVRSSSTRAAVDGRLSVVAGSALADRVDELGADLDDGYLLISRVVGADGRSRAQLGGRPVPVGALAELADGLIAVHGQSEQALMRSAARQRDAIDNFGGAPLLSIRDTYRDAYRAYLDAETRRRELTEQTRDRVQEADALRFGLGEVAAASPQPGEDVALVAEIARLGHADLLGNAAAEAHVELVGDPAADELPDAAGLLARARSALERAAPHDEALGALAATLAQAGYLVADVAAELASYTDGLDADPARLEAAQRRLALLTPLTRKYATNDTAGLAGVLAWAGEASHRLTELESDDSVLLELAGEVATLRGDVERRAGDLTAARREAAARFGRAVTDELRELAMPHAEVSAQVRDAAPGPNGSDEVEILLVPHPGAPARPIAKGASGGELSRIMLAVEVVFAGAGSVPTFVFDEVDAGVGGRAAVEIGRRLARLAKVAQVIVVTHLPQVAAFADRHLSVVKSDDGLVTSSGVVALDDDGRVEELSRMLAGLDGSALAAGHAAELLSAAAAFKAGR
jgi:DNA repair protein RecN (Recombination protein N)